MNRELEQQLVDYYSTADKYILSLSAPVIKCRKTPGKM